MNFEEHAIDRIREKAVPLTGVSSDYDALLDRIGDAQIVLLGEGTHGTEQFYAHRAYITERLIAEKGFNAIAIEGDFPDSYQVNQYIHDEKYNSAGEALAAFDRFPAWMWQNVTVMHCVERLKKFNRAQQVDHRVGFYGLDLYSLYRSIDAVIMFLEKIDPQAAAQARYHYACFDQFRKDPQYYAYAVFSQAAESCEYEVVEQLKQIQQQSWEYIERGKRPLDDLFYIEQNARVVKNSEEYYRSLFKRGVNTWNLRDAHMFETLNELIKHYTINKSVPEPKIIVWAHNSHVGDASATDMAERGEFNIGQLIKRQFGNKAVSVGFTTYHGTVSAASEWHAPVERKLVRNAHPGSYEALFHETGVPNFLLILEGDDVVPYKALERAIGVIYKPETELQSHYFYARLQEQFDAIIHCDKTTAVEPLEKTAGWLTGEVPETYPSGL